MGPLMVLSNTVWYGTFANLNGRYLGLYRTNSKIGGATAWYSKVDCQSTDTSLCYLETITSGSSSSKVITGGNVIDHTDLKTYLFFS